MSTALKGPLLHSHVGNPLDGAPLHLITMLGLGGGGHGYASHLMFWEGPTAEGADAGWTLSGVTGAATVVVPADIQNGAIQLTCAAGADNNGQLEYKGNLHYTVGKRMWCFARLALSDANDMEAIFGLGEPGNTDFIAGLPGEGFFFEKAETATTWDFHARDGGTSTERAAAFSGLTLADDVMQVVGFYVDDLGNITPYWITDPTATVWTAGTNIAAGTANIPDDAGDELSLYFGIETGNSEADYMEVDWVIAAQET